MRICLTVHGFPPFERTGVENYTRSLAAALVRAGHVVEVFAPCPPGDLPNLALRREVIDGVGVNWLAAGRPARDPGEMLNPPGIATRFGAFLDRERPDVVHFQHVVKLGTALIGEAHKRKIATIYTAHDYYAHCHRYTLLRPDLKRCETIGDPEACARCDQASAVLNSLEGLGDYQMGVRPEQLDVQSRERLEAALDGRSTDAGFTVEDQEASLSLRKQLDKRRLADFRKLDLLLAPTLFLRDRLIEGGLDAAKIEHLPYGIETGDLEAIAREHPIATSDDESTKPLRIGFFGGFSKHKGVHVLLSAFQKLRNPAELALHGIGSDKPYVEALRKQADEVGASWCGHYESSELPALMADVDVVVVPSLWVENYPIVIREAFAAKRPVITSRLGALSESVRDGVDGLLFEPGSANELCEALESLSGNRARLAELVAGILPAHSIDQQVAELGEIYNRVFESPQDESNSALPASLEQHVQRYNELKALPMRELFQQTMGGLHELSAGLLGKNSSNTMELFAAALGRGSNVQDLLRDRRRESDWVKQTLEAEEEELQSLTQKLEWMNRVADAGNKTVEELRKERQWLEESIGSKEQEISALAAERDEASRARTDLDQQREWLQSALDATKAEIEDLGKKADWLENGWEQSKEIVEELASAREELAADRDSMAGKLWDLKSVLSEERREKALLKTAVVENLHLALGHEQTVRKQIQEIIDKTQLLDAKSQQLTEQAKGLSERDESIERHQLIETELRTWLESSREILERIDDDGDNSEGEGDAELSPNKDVKANWELVLSDVESLLDSDSDNVTPNEWGRQLSLILERLESQARELSWRRGEMLWVTSKADRWMGRLALLSGAVRKRVQTWNEEEQDHD